MLHLRQNYGSVEQLLVGIGLLLSERKIADFLEISLLPRKLWRFPLICDGFALFCRTALFAFVF